MVGRQAEGKILLLKGISAMTCLPNPANNTFIGKPLWNDIFAKKALHVRAGQITLLRQKDETLVKYVK